MGRRACVQVYCDSDFAFLPRLAPYLPLDRPVSVLDAGTNVGLAAILFAQLIKFHGEVVAVDANPETLTVRHPPPAPPNPPHPPPTLPPHTHVTIRSLTASYTFKRGNGNVAA